MGGCSVSSYAIYRDNGTNDAFATSMDPATIGNNPYLFENTFTLPSYLTGDIIRYKLQATNEIGSTLSTAYLSAILAGIPPAPTSGPINIPLLTTASSIGVQMPQVSDDGGSEITSYNLMMDDGKNGDFVSVAGYPIDNLEQIYTFTQGIVKGNTYRFMYRVKNILGWSDYSDHTYILAAGVPSQPPPPQLSDSAPTYITLVFTASADNGGSLITSYELYMDAGSGYS